MSFFIAQPNIILNGIICPNKNIVKLKKTVDVLAVYDSTFSRPF